MKAALDRELKWLEEKREIEEQAAAILGEDVAKKIQEFQDTRNEAYAASQFLLSNIYKEFPYP